MPRCLMQHAAVLLTVHCGVCEGDNRGLLDCQPVCCRAAHHLNMPVICYKASTMHDHSAVHMNIRSMDQQTSTLIYFNISLYHNRIVQNHRLPVTNPHRLQLLLQMKHRKEPGQKIIPDPEALLHKSAVYFYCSLNSAHLPAAVKCRKKFTLRR